MSIDLKKYFTRIPFLRNTYQLKFSTLDLLYKPEDLHAEYYQKAKISGDQELEHQIGRLINFKAILQEISQNRLSGDIIEFGTWKGFSLLWIAYLVERLGMFEKRMIGVDGFTGLPNSEGVFKKNAFSDTSLVMCREGIYRSKQLYDITKKNIAIEQFLYHQKDQILKRIVELQSTKFCFIHIDCDLSSSVEEIFKILQEGNLLADTCYVLFDDYGCATDLKQVADSILKTIKTKGWEVQEHSQTIFTKNFKLTRQN